MPAAAAHPTTLTTQFQPSLPFPLTKPNKPFSFFAPLITFFSSPKPGHRLQWTRRSRLISAAAARGVVIKALDDDDNYEKYEEEEEEDEEGNEEEEEEEEEEEYEEGYKEGYDEEEEEGNQEGEEVEEKEEEYEEGYEAEEEEEGFVVPPAVVGNFGDLPVLKERLGVVVGPSEKQRVVLKFIWMGKNIGIALDTYIPGHGTIPLSPYYFWPRKDAWEELKVLIESKPWISQKQMIILLNQATDIINLWQQGSGNLA
ncbi:Small ribosomal subunit protein cS23-like protein [Drosera capensis]